MELYHYKYRVRKVVMMDSSLAAVHLEDYTIRIKVRLSLKCEQQKSYIMVDWVRRPQAALLERLREDACFKSSIVYLMIERIRMPPYLSFIV